VLKVAIDTNYLVALVDEQDAWHSKACKIRDALKKAKAEYIYLDCVFNETISVLAKRLEEKGQSERLVTLLSNLEQFVPEDKITWVSQQGQNLLQEILGLVRSSKGSLNFHDSLIALVLRESGIKYLVSFDSDFDGINWLERIYEERAVQR